MSFGYSVLGFGAHTSSSSFAPTDISGLLFWYDAKTPSSLWQDPSRTTQVSAADQKIGAWDDLSGNGHHATQGTEADKPYYRESVMGSTNPGIECGISDYLLIPATASAGDYTVFVVFSASDLSSNFYIMDNTTDRLILGNETTNSFGYYEGAWQTASGVSTSTDYVGTWRLDSTNATSGTVDLNRSEIVAGEYTQRALGTGTFYIANNDASSWRGYISSIIWYEGNLSDSDVASVEDYLAARYGITL